VLDIFAGPAALRRLRKDGFEPELFTAMLGASGGPKWFVLAGLDRVIIPEFLANTEHQVSLIGTSAGAFRCACLAQQQPLTAINRLAEHYSQTVYAKRPLPSEISNSAADILQKMLGQHGVTEVLQNSRFKASFIVARCAGWLATEDKWQQTAGLLRAAMANARSRHHLTRFVDRVTFSTEALEITDPYALGNQLVTLDHENFTAALLASGSIPVVMQGIRDIAGAGLGMYRDGGIIDYHFDFRLAHQPSESLTLYPHFYPSPIPGWFDKQLKRRLVHHTSYDNVVMLVPSAEFVAKLPFGKISDRNDFKLLGPEQRIPYWQTILSESDRLGEYFMQGVANGTLVDAVQPLPFSVK
jgi:hypothetical protein